MPRTIYVEMPASRHLGRLKLPWAVQSRLHKLLDRQDKGIKLTPRERREAEGLSEVAKWISSLKLRKRRLSRS